MKEFAQVLLALLVLAPGPRAFAAPPKASPKPEGADALLEKVQRFYDRTTDFRADFIQTYTRVALSKTQESRGTVMIKKPGMMRWSYTKPAEKLFVADGKQLFIYEPEEEQVIIDPHFNTSELSSSVSFLFGKGNLKDSFNAAMGDASGAPAGTDVLSLTPKSDATFQTLDLIVQPSTGEVLESVIHETSGNLNRFKFSNTKTNSGIKADAFTFTPPPNVEIVRKP
jgi:outer membrane lipoprotein carrier protein